MNLTEIGLYLNSTGTEVLPLDDKNGHAFGFVLAHADENDQITHEFECSVSLIDAELGLGRITLSGLLDEEISDWANLFAKLARDNYLLKLVRLAVDEANEACFIVDLWLDELTAERFELINDMLINAALEFIEEYKADFSD
jgi:hypothetical protein